MSLLNIFADAPMKKIENLVLALTALSGKSVQNFILKNLIFIWVKRLVNVSNRDTTYRTLNCSNKNSCFLERKKLHFRRAIRYKIYNLYCLVKYKILFTIKLCNKLMYINMTLTNPFFHYRKMFLLLANNRKKIRLY